MNNNLKLVNVVTLLNEGGKAYWGKRVKNTSTKFTTRSCIPKTNTNTNTNTKTNTTCPMFCILKKDFDNTIKKVCPTRNSNGSLNYNSRIMQNIQTKLGLPTNWGKYTGILQFKVPIHELYRPIKIKTQTQNNAKVYMIRPKNIVGPLNSNKKAYYLKKLSLIPNKSVMSENNIIKKPINQKLNDPFVGNGKTKVLGNFQTNIINEKEKGFSEYVIPGKVEMSNIKFYDTYTEYVNNMKLCSNNTRRF